MRARIRTPEIKLLRRVNLQNSPLCEANVKLLAENTGLEFLEVYGCGITERGVKELTKLTKLKTLYIGYNRFPDASVKAFRSFPDLETLSFSNSGRIGDQGVRDLSGLKKLKSLDLKVTNVTKSRLTLSARGRR